LLTSGSSPPLGTRQHFGNFACPLKYWTHTRFSDTASKGLVEAGVFAVLGREIHIVAR
jgi:hypothetical protein